MLNPTPADQMVDERGHPYFLPPELDMTLDQYRTAVADPNLGARAFFLAHLLCNARPDDVFFVATPGKIQEAWPQLEPYLGHRKEFWTDLFELLKELELVRR